MLESAKLATISLVLAVILVCIPISSIAAKVLPSHTSQFLTRISPSEGLSQSFATKTVQDSHGFIWIGTQMGLNRFDGYNVKQIKGPNNVFEKEIISTLYLDKQGFLWISTVYSGLYRMNTTTYESKKFFNGKIKPEDKSYSEVTVIKQENEHIFWLGISNTVYRLDISTGQITNFLTLNTLDDIIRDFYLDNGILYTATSDGLYKILIKSNGVSLIPHKPPSIQSLDSDNTKRLLHDNTLGLLVGTVDGLFHIPQYKSVSKVTSSPKLLIPNLNIWDMIWMENYYLVATDKGLYKFNPKTLAVTLVLKFSDSIYQTTDNNILDLFKDSTGNIWLASKSQGVMVWSPLTTRFTHVTTSSIPKLSHENVWALHQDKNNDLWIGTDNGLNKVSLDTEDNITYLATNNLKQVSGSHVIRSIFANSADDSLLWVVNDDGFFIFDKTTGQVRPPYLTKASQSLIQNKWISGFFVNDNENIFFYNEDGHLHYNSITGKITPLTALDNMFDVDLSWSFIDHFPDRANTILLTTSGHLYEYDLTTQEVTLVYKVKNYQQQSFDYVDSWVIDKNNILWLAMTGEGLIGLNYTTFEERYRFDTTNQLATNHIYSLQLDENNNLWFSSQSGLYQLNLDSLHVERFTTKDGLIADEFNGYSFSRLHDNRLAFGSPLGVTLLSPSDFQKTTTTQANYHVKLTDISLMSNTERNLNKQKSELIELEHDDYGLKLQFSTLQFYKQSKTKYNYTLFGPSPLAISNYESNELLLPKLPAGNYKLKVTATDPRSGIKSYPLQLNIRAKFSPWSSPQAKFTALFLIISILAFYINNRRLRKNELVKAHSETRASKERMQLALQGSNSGIWDYRVSEDKLYEERIISELSYTNLSLPITYKEHAALIKPEHYLYLKAKWIDFINGESNDWDASYQMRSSTGEWYWYRDIGRVIERNNQGIPIRVSGTYTNITETKVNEAQAILFGEAFSQINDWVLILDASKQPITANDAFLSAFSIDRINTSPSLNIILSKLGKQKYNEYIKIIENIKPKQSWQGEETIETASSKQHPVLIKINAITKDNNVISHYVIVISDITMQKHAENKLRHLAHYDYLTDLPNRKLILEKLENKIKYSKNSCALFFIDLDKFKQINDLYGHLVGDNLLKHVAKSLVNSVKQCDIVARQSGDEFMILIEKFEHINDLTHIAQRLNRKLSETIILKDIHLNITSSIGISIFPNDSKNAAGLIKKADLAMIHAKRKGRGQFQFFTEDMNEKAHQRIILENQLKKACAVKSFVNFYQPIVNHLQQKVIGFELLLRWQHEGGMIPPDVFIPIAEEIGLISQITVDAIEQALIDFGTWHSQFPDSYISINLSPVHILQEGLSQTLNRLLNKYQLPTSVLRLEITEGTLLADLDIALVRLDELRSSGFKLLLDDFGTGYSSLTYLSKFPINVIKIDKSFILNLETHSINKPIIKSIIALANNLGLSCIAEGVENEVQLTYLQNLGCEAIQGYYFAKPMPAADVAQLTSDFVQKHNRNVSKLTN